MDSAIKMCVFRPGGVICSTYDQCEKCGFNPSVETERIEKFREKRKEAIKNGMDGT